MRTFVYPDVLKGERPTGMSALDVIQYRTELPTKICQKVLDDLHQFMHRMPAEEVDALLIKYWNESAVNIICAMEEIAHRTYGAIGYMHLSLMRVQAHRRPPVELDRYEHFDEEN